jgi:hypothetical protein
MERPPPGRRTPSGLVQRQLRQGVQGGVFELAVINEDHFMSRPPLILEEVLEHAEDAQLRYVLPQFLADLANDCLHRGLAELDGTSQRASKHLLFDVIRSFGDEDSVAVTEDADGDDTDLG